MSHFSVLVITSDGNYESALEPFYEGLEVESYITVTREDILEYAREQHDKQLKGESNRYEEEFGNIALSDEKGLIKHYREYWEEDGVMFDEKDNRLSTYNPLSKWDWYSLGGRWNGYLKYKNCTKHDYPINDVDLFNEEPCDAEHGNFAQVKDVDWDDFMKPVKDKKKLERIWEIHVEGKVRELGEDFETPFLNKKGFLARYGDKETYVNTLAFERTYAILDHGEWISQGNMGWFGIDDADKDSLVEYARRYDEIIANLNPDDYIAIVDCHI